jgi:hypothetical protein
LLPAPKSQDGFYRDTYVLAYRMKDEPARADLRPAISASTSQDGMPPEKMLDGDASTFWVSRGKQEGEGPSAQRPEWVQLMFPRPVEIGGVRIVPRAGYGPKDGTWQESDDGKRFRDIQIFTARPGADITIRFAPTTATCFRLLISNSFDPRFPAAPRNVQIAEMVLLNKDGQPVGPGMAHRTIRDLRAKSAFNEVGGSAPDCSFLLEDVPGKPGEEDVQAKDVIDLSSSLGKDGRLVWDVPPGAWDILRFGYTTNGARVSTSSGTWKGPVVDYLDADALRHYWHRVVDPLLDAIGPLAGKSLVGIETDSWEAGGVNWTARMPEEFRRRRGYDLKPYLLVLAGKIVDSRDESNRFLDDFRKTIGDLMADDHYGVLADLARQHGMFIHCEASGPHAGPFDGLKNLGRCGAPMGEFWVESPHRPTEESRFFGKVAASAAHIYGKQIACAEGFTSIGPNWDDILWKSQKPTFDHEACAGVNLVYWHAFTCSPASMGVPGQEYFAGTHFDPQITWADQASAFVSYLNRCQFLLQQGKFVADVCYYYGDQVPNIVQRKQADPAGVLPGYDYDVCDEEVLLNRMSVKDGRIVLPDGMSYRVLALPKLTMMSLAAVRKVQELVQAGAVVIGPKPEQTDSLTGYPECDAELQHIANGLWDTGKVISNKTTKEVLAGLGVKPDFEAEGHPELDYIHRRDGDADIYFIRNPEEQAVTATCWFRVVGKQPEIWDPVTGQRRAATAFMQKSGRTSAPLELQPYGSIFVVFRKAIAADAAGGAATNFPPMSGVSTVDGPWSVQFDPKWGGPAKPVVFDRLDDWAQRPEDGIRYYSGTAVYRKTFDLPAALSSKRDRLYLELGTVHEFADVRLNGKELGIVWCPPWRVDITDAVKQAGNQLEIKVVNLWPNRLIGDGQLPADKRLTHTNVLKLYGPAPGGGAWPLMPSGLLGPVTIQAPAGPPSPTPLSRPGGEPLDATHSMRDVRQPAHPTYQSCSIEARFGAVSGQARSITL